MVGNTEDGSEISSFALARYISGLETSTISPDFYDESLSIAPNPVKDKAVFSYTLNQDQEISIDLFDLNGKWVQSFIQNKKRKKGNNEEHIAIDAKLASGTYFLTINQEVGMKVLVQ